MTTTPTGAEHEDKEFEPNRVQITTHISLEARQVLERAKQDTRTPLGRLIDEAVLTHLAQYRRP